MSTEPKAYVRCPATGMLTAICGCPMCRMAARASARAERVAVVAAIVSNEEAKVAAEGPREEGDEDGKVANPG